MKTYLLIGGKSGIGAALAEQLKSQGHIVHTTSREGAETSTHHLLDVLDDDPTFPELNSPIDGLVYCPGSINLKPIKSLKPKHFREDFELNVIGFIKTLHAYREALIEAKSASVVLFSTVAVQTGMSYHASVAASKGAIEGLARSLAAEFAPKIRVNVVAPSLTDTPLAKRLLRTDAQREASAERHPLKQIGEAKNVADAAAFLLSDQSLWMTGQVIGVDGGMSAIKSI